MADAVLDFLTQLGEALVVAFWYEDWVVAETFGAVLLGGDSDRLRCRQTDGSS